MKALTLILTLALLTAATAAQAEDDSDDISLYYGRMERNAQDAETFQERSEPQSGVTNSVKILFNQKVEDSNVSQEEGPGFVPVKHCVTGELVSRYAYDRDCARPVHGTCYSLGKDKNGNDIVTCR